MNTIFFDNLLFGSAVGFLFAQVWEWVTCRLFDLNHLAKKKGYHFHHSLMGPGAWFLLPRFFSISGVITFGLGAGVILQHWKNEGLTFITKIKEHKTDA